MPFVPQVLLLGCGDIRNGLVSAPALLQLQTAKPPRISNNPQQQQQQQPQIEIHLNDISDVILARDVVLLCITQSINPSCDDDMQFLWGVWFNAVLSQRHKQRLDQLLQQVCTLRVQSELSAKRPSGGWGSTGGGGGCTPSPPPHMGSALTACSLFSLCLAGTRRLAHIRALAL
jgi:hypothetical protein